MLLEELFEKASLPLIPKELNRVRGSYGAFVITMPPMNFLKLTTDDDMLAQLLDHPFPQSKEEFTATMGGRDEHFGRYSLPFLKVSFPDGKVFGHEGRHRAIMVMRAGGKAIPVVIYPKEQTIYTAWITYTVYGDYDVENDTFGEDTEHTVQLGEFTSRHDAEQAWEAAKAKLDPDYWVERFSKSYEATGGGTLKGAPARSNRSQWEWAAWRPEDMPTTLIGQYDDSVHVSGFRVGIVKGYHHHRIK